MPPHGRSGGAVAAPTAAPGPFFGQPGAPEGGLAAAAPWRLLFAPLVALALILACGLAFAWWLADRLVREDARFLAATVAQVLGRVVPDLETTLENGRLGAEQAEALRRAVAGSRVLRVALLDRSGRPLQAGREPLPSGSSGHGADGAVAALVAEVRATGASRALVRTEPAPGRRTHVGEAVVPIGREGRPAGFVHISLDLTDKVADYHRIFRGSLVVAGALFLLAALVPSTVLYRRLKQLEATAAEVRHLAFHDPLTGLPNRLLFQDRLAQAIARVGREGGRGALLMLDLDDFKAVNDAFGHAAGDELLRAVGRRLVGAVRATDTVARLGGDEFALVIAPFDGLDGLAAVLERLRAALARPVAIDGRRIEPAATIGIALFPDDGGEPDPLVRRADAALYRGKAKGRGAVVWHRAPAEMPADMRARRSAG